MLIRWLQETTFLIQSSTGRRILIDPTNLPLTLIEKISPSIIACSTPNSILNEVDIIYKNSYIIDSPGLNDYDSIKVNSIPSFKDKHNGKKRGENLITVINIDDINICHLGRIGEIPNREVLEKLKEINYLFIPIGGNFTINYKEAVKLISLIKPNFVIPMYYKNHEKYTYLDSPKNFFINSKNLVPLHSELLNTKSVQFLSNPTTLIIDESKNFYSYLP